MLRDWIERGRHGRLTLFLVLLAVLLGVAIVAAIAIGSTSIAPGTVVRVLASRLLPFAHISGVDETETIVIWIVRTPRVLVAALVGAALAIAGAQMQGLFQNPMASPDIIATSSGAALGAVLAIALGFAQVSLFWLPLWPSSAR